MALFRYLFAPALLAVAVVTSPPVQAPRSHAADPAATRARARVVPAHAVVPAAATARAIASHPVSVR